MSVIRIVIDIVQRTLSIVRKEKKERLEKPTRITQ
jgi:hypothetical protein